MKVTVNVRDKRAPQRVTNEIIKIEMKAGVMNTMRSSDPPVYAHSDLESELGVSRKPERVVTGRVAKASMRGSDSDSFSTIMSSSAQNARVGFSALGGPAEDFCNTLAVHPCGDLFLFIKSRRDHDAKYDGIYHKYERYGITFRNVNLMFLITDNSD